MDTSHHTESRRVAHTHEGISSLQPRVIDFDFDFDFEPHRLPNQYPRCLTLHHVPVGYLPGALPAQYGKAYSPVNAFPARGDWHQPPTGHGPLVLDGHNPIRIFSIQPQRRDTSHIERAAQTIQSESFTRESNTVWERPQAHRRSTPRGLARQEPYKLVRHQPEFTGSEIIKFFVDGEEGIRLSGALKGNWAGFEGRDDRSLFEGDRSQIIIRLQPIGCLPWNSKISTTDFTARRQPITRTRLVTEVAKRMKKFIEREKSIGHDGGHPGCSWGEVSLENVFLNRMVRVSAASWQPELCVERSSAASQSMTPSWWFPNRLA